MALLRKLDHFHTKIHFLTSSTKFTHTPTSQILWYGLISQQKITLSVRNVSQITVGVYNITLYLFSVLSMMTLTVMKFMASTLVVALATQSAVAIRCYDCSDDPTFGCSTCENPSRRCTRPCVPCSMDESTPTCDNSTMCFRAERVTTNATGGQH